MQFTSSTSTGDDAVVVRLVGEVDRDTSGELITVLTAAVAEAGRGGAVAVDLAGVSFLDSSGVGALLTGRQRALEQDVRFAVHDPQPAVHQILEITSVWRLLSRP